MHTPLLVFEFLGTTELLVIAVVALILFGPRKLPEIGRQVGKSLAEFKRASDDFKRTWEYEVEIEQRRPALEEPAPATRIAAATATDAPAPTTEAEGYVPVGDAHPDSPEPTVARGAAEPEESQELTETTAATPDAYADEGAWDVATGRAHSSAPRNEESPARADGAEDKAS